MGYTPYGWRDNDPTTPWSAANAIAMETRLAAYTDSRVSVLQQTVVNAKDNSIANIVADGSTDDTAAWDTLIAGLPDGAAVTWNGNSKIQPGRHFTGRVALIGQGRRTAFTIAGGVNTNDGITLGGTDGLRWFHAIKDVDILGGASCCRRALVLLNLIDPDVDVRVKAGATDYGVSIEGMQNAKLCKVTVSNNGPGLAYSGTAPVNGVRVIGSALIPTNANRFHFNVEALTGLGVFSDGSVGAGGSYNNWLSGVIQGNGGQDIELRHWTEFELHDLHVEGSSGLTLTSCLRGTIGPGVFVSDPIGTTHGLTDLVLCDQITVDGLTTTNLTIEPSTTNVELRRYKINGGALTDGNASTIRWWEGRGQVLVERTDPAAPAANQAFLYARDNGAGKTQIVARFPTGVVQVIATEP